MSTTKRTIIDSTKARKSADTPPERAKTLLTPRFYCRTRSTFRARAESPVARRATFVQSSATTRIAPVPSRSLPRRVVAQSDWTLVRRERALRRRRSPLGRLVSVQDRIRKDRKRVRCAIEDRRTSGEKKNN